jgi:hypothetical protein
MLSMVILYYIAKKCLGSSKRLLGNQWGQVLNLALSQKPSYQQPESPLKNNAIIFEVSARSAE